MSFADCEDSVKCCRPFADLLPTLRPESRNSCCPRLLFIDSIVHIECSFMNHSYAIFVRTTCNVGFFLPSKHKFSLTSEQIRWTRLHRTHHDFTILSCGSKRCVCLQKKTCGMCYDALSQACYNCRCRVAQESYASVLGDISGKS